MNHPRTLTTEQAARAVTVLSHPGLIRLVSEIDDNGPVQRHMLQRTFTDLTRHQIRHALTTGRDHDLIRVGHHASPCYLLTDRGADLAEVYDQAARWARSHNYPSRHADFVTRVQQALALLGHEPIVHALSGAANSSVAALAAHNAIDAGLLSDSAALVSLYQPWMALSRWIGENSSVLSTAVHQPSNTALPRPACTT